MNPFSQGMGNVNPRGQLASLGDERDWGSDFDNNNQSGVKKESRAYTTANGNKYYVDNNVSHTGKRFATMTIPAAHANPNDIQDYMSDWKNRPEYRPWTLVPFSGGLSPNPRDPNSTQDFNAIKAMSTPSDTNSGQVNVYPGMTSDNGYDSQWNRAKKGNPPPPPTSINTKKRSVAGRMPGTINGKLS